MDAVGVVCIHSCAVCIHSCSVCIRSCVVWMQWVWCVHSCTVSIHSCVDAVAVVHIHSCAVCIHSCVDAVGVVCIHSCAVCIHSCVDAVAVVYIHCCIHSSGCGWVCVSWLLGQSCSADSVALQFVQERQQKSDYHSVSPSRSPEQLTVHQEFAVFGDYLKSVAAGSRDRELIARDIALINRQSASAVEQILNELDEMGSAELQLERLRIFARQTAPDTGAFVT